MRDEEGCAFLCAVLGKVTGDNFRYLCVVSNSCVYRLATQICVAYKVRTQKRIYKTCPCAEQLYFDICMEGMSLGFTFIRV